jgi:hypothetical protein
MTQEQRRNGQLLFVEAARDLYAESKGMPVTAQKSYAHSRLRRWQGADAWYEFSDEYQTVSFAGDAAGRLGLMILRRC